MKTRCLKIGLTITAATLATAFINTAGTLSQHQKAKESTLVLVHEASRIAHAKELLGGEYTGSAAQQLEGKQSLSMVLQKKVQNSLAPKWKAQAPIITETVITESAKHQLDPVFVLAVIKTESKFNPLARGQFGEIGLMQLKPSTAEWIAQKYNLPWHGAKTLENPSANIRIGLAYMSYLRTKFNRTALKYVSAYNMGPTNVRRLIAKSVKPMEYNSRVMKNYSEIYSVITAKAESKPTLVASNSWSL